jgi:hypothetical protein
MKGWLDNFGKADNANESNVSLPEGFVGLGYDTKGRNYSPAWGGQFEQGGIIPIAQNGVSEYMNKKMQEKEDATIAKQYDLPEVVVSAPYLTKFNDPDKLTGYPQYVPKPGDNVNSPGWDIAEFYKSWVSSPEYERRMKNTGYYEDAGGRDIYGKGHPVVRLQYNDFLDSARKERMKLLEGTQEPGFIKTEADNYLGQPASTYRWSGISIHPEHAKTPETYQTTLAHEIAHAIDTPSNFEKMLIYNTMLTGDDFDQPQFYGGVDPNTGRKFTDAKSRIRRAQAMHVRDPEEFKSDLNALRYLMFDKGVYDIRKGKEFTKEDLERAKEKLKGNQSLERSIDAAGESGLIKLMNVIAKGKEDVTPIAMNGASMPGSVGFTYARVAGAAPSKGKYAKKTMASAQNGQEMRFYQNGLDWKPKSMQNGGITKDNLGYWNPDNWGKPVEIGSNNITMEGVYEPLLGISDTGDTKLMQPGKNYKFNGKKVTEFPVAQPGKTVPAQQEVSRQDYLSKFNMYDDVLKSKNYTTPYYKDNNIDTSEGDMNCINGVCYMVSNIAGVKFDKGQTKDTYTGNATFSDNAMDEGYYRSNPEKEGFGVGDIFQYARKKGNTFSRFPGEVDFRNENDLYPNHAVLIVNEFVKDGKKYFKVANNAGGDKVEIEDVSESELMNRYKKGYKTFDGGITYRYDPDKVTSIKKENQDKINVLKGKNPYSGQYSKFDTSNLTFFNNKVDGLNVKNELAPDKNLQRYADVYKTVYSDLGKGSNMPIDSFNKLIMNQIGIAGQETKFGELASNPKDIVPDSLLPYARRFREIYDYNFGEEDNWKKDYWDKNADNVQKEFSSYQDFVKSLDSEDSDYSPYRTPRSVGEFQQKDLSERGNFYKYDLDSFEGQVKSSLALAVDNYHKLKAKYPDLSEDQIIDLTTLMHNAPGKALEPRFVNYYLKRNDVDYIDKVKGFAPKSFGKDQSKNEKIEWKTEKISPEEAKSIADYVRSLPKTKRNGGDVGINQLDAQPMKKLNQLLNFTNNPDKDNWLDKYN